MLPMMQLQVETYIKKQPASDINLSGGGSGTGITSLLDGTIDLAMSSRDLKLAEKIKFKEKNQEIKTVQVAIDALSIIVHPQNSVSKLTQDQLMGIFTGQITNWKDVGGADQKIVLYSRESSSGTYEFMKDNVLDKKEFAKEAISTSATAQIVYAVSQNKSAIGYVGLAYVENIVKPLPIAFDGKDFVAPSFNNAAKGIYPITRPLFLIYNVSNEAKVKPFLDYILSVQGQKLVTHKGFIPVSWN